MADTDSNFVGNESNREETREMGTLSERHTSQVEIGIGMINEGNQPDQLGTLETLGIISGTPRDVSQRDELITTILPEWTAKLQGAGAKQKFEAELSTRRQALREQQHIAAAELTKAQASVDKTSELLSEYENSEPAEMKAAYFTHIQQFVLENPQYAPELQKSLDRMGSELFDLVQDTRRKISRADQLYQQLRIDNVELKKSKNTLLDDQAKLVTLLEHLQHRIADYQKEEQIWHNESRIFDKLKKSYQDLQTRYNEAAKTNAPKSQITDRTIESVQQGFRVQQDHAAQKRRSHTHKNSTDEHVMQFPKYSLQTPGWREAASRNALDLLSTTDEISFRSRAENKLASSIETIGVEDQNLTNQQQQSSDLILSMKAANTKVEAALNRLQVEHKKLIERFDLTLRELDAAKMTIKLHDETCKEPMRPENQNQNPQNQIHVLGTVEQRKDFQVSELEVGLDLGSPKITRHQSQNIASEQHMQCLTDPSDHDSRDVHLIRKELYKHRICDADDGKLQKTISDHVSRFSSVISTYAKFCITSGSSCTNIARPSYTPVLGLDYQDDKSLKMTDVCIGVMIDIDQYGSPTEVLTQRLWKAFASCDDDDFLLGGCALCLTLTNAVKNMLEPSYESNVASSMLILRCMEVLITHFKTKEMIEFLRITLDSVRQKLSTSKLVHIMTNLIEDKLVGINRTFAALLLNEESIQTLHQYNVLRTGEKEMIAWINPEVIGLIGQQHVEISRYYSLFDVTFTNAPVIGNANFKLRTTEMYDILRSFI